MADDSGVLAQNVGEGASECPIIQEANMKVKNSMVKSEAEAASKANGIPSEKLKAEDKTGNDTSINNNSNNNNSGTNKWEDRLRLTREKQLESLKKRADGLKEAELKAEECRKKADDERKRKLEEMRKREEQHRVVVEERRKKMLESENEKRLALMKKTMGRDLKLDQLKQKNSDNKFLNGTKSPKQQQQHQQQQQPSPQQQQQQQQQVKRPHSVAGRPPSYASPTVASTTRMARSSEKDGEVITVCFRCRSAPPDFRSKFLEQQQHTSSGQNRSSHPVFSVTVPAVEFFSARSSVSNGHKDNKQLNGKFDMKPSIVLRPSETLSSKPPLPTISASSKGTVQQKPRPKRPVSAVLESSRESTLAMLEARNLKNLQMQKQSQTSASSPSSIDSKKKPKNRFDLSLDLKKDHSGDLAGDDVKPKRKELLQAKKRSLSAIPDRKKIADHDTGKSVFIAESSVGFSATTPFPSAKVLPSTGKQQTKVQKDMTNRLESKNRKLPVVPSAEVKKKDQLKERGTSAPKPSFLAPKTKQTPPSFEIKRPLPRLPKQLEQDGEKKTEEKQEVTKTPVKDFPKDDVKKIHKQKDAKKAKEQVAKESKSPHETVPSKVNEVKAKDVEAKVKATEIKVKPIEKVDKKVTKSEKVEKTTPMTEKAELIETPGKTEQKVDEAAKVEHVESGKVIEQKEKQRGHSEKDKEASKREEQKKVAENVDQPKDSGTEVREQAAETNEEARQESTTPKTEAKIAERDQEINKREQERLEKLRKDEEERLNRKKRVDLIMKRVKPDETSRSSSVEKESKSSDETIKVENKEEVTAATDVKAKEEKSQEPEESEAKIDATDASSIEAQESNLGEEEELGEEYDGSKPGKSSFFDKLTSKLKKALSPSDKKGFPKTEQPINIQDVSGLLLLTALEKPTDETETATSGEEGHPAAEIPHERRESSGSGFFGRISKRLSKDISAEEKPLKQEDSSSSKDSSPPLSEGAQVTEKRKSITEAAFSMFGMMSKQKRPSKELEITPEEKTTGMDGDKKAVEKEVPIRDHEEAAKNVLPEEQLKDKEMNVIKDRTEQEEERVSPIVSEYVPGLEDEEQDGQERRTTRDRVDGMDDTVNSAVTGGSSKSPPDQVSEKPETKELGTVKKMEKDENKTEKEDTKKKELRVQKGEEGDKDLKQVDDKQTKEPSASAKGTDVSDSPNTTVSEASKATEVKPPEMINVTSPEMINIVVQKRDEELSTNLSNLDSNPSGSTSSLDIVKSEDSSSGDILMSDESPTEVKGQQEKERTEGKTTGIRKDDFDSSEQKAVMKEEAPVCTDSLPGKSEADMAATGLDASSSKFTPKEAILTNGYHDDLDEFFDNSVAQVQHVDKARYNGGSFNVRDVASSDAGKGQTDLQKIDPYTKDKRQAEKTLEDKASSQPQQVSEVNLNEQTKQRDASTAQVSSERSMTLELKALASSQTLSSTMTTTSSVTISTGSLDSLQSETHLPSCEFVRSDLTSSEFTEIAQIDAQAESKLAAATEMRIDNLKKVDLKPSESHLFTDSTETGVGDAKEIDVKKLGDNVFEVEVKENETIPKNKIDGLELNLKTCTDQKVKQKNFSEAEKNHVINKDIDSLTEMIPQGVNEPSGEKIGASPNNNIISILSSTQSDAPALEESQLTKSSVTPTSQDGSKLEMGECSVNEKHEVVHEPLRFKKTDEAELSASIPDNEVKENLEIHDTKTSIDIAKVGEKAVTDQTTDKTKEPSHEQAFEISHIKHKDETIETEYSTGSADVNIIPSNVSACQTSTSGVTVKSCTKAIAEKEHLDAKDKPAICLDETRTDSNENKKVESKEPSTQNDISPLEAMTTEVKSPDKELQHGTVKALEQKVDDVKSACDKKASISDRDDIKTKQIDSSLPDSAVVKETQFNEVVQHQATTTDKRENDFVHKENDMKQNVGQPSRAQIDMKKSEDRLSLTNAATSEPIKASKDIATLNEESPDRQIETNLEEIPSLLVQRLSVNEVKESFQFHTLEDPSEDLHKKSVKDGEHPTGDQLTKIDQSEVSSKQIESPKEIIDHSGSKEFISSPQPLDAIDKSEKDGSIEQATISVRTSTTETTACDVPSQESTLEWTQYSVMDSYKQTTDSRSVETSEDVKDFQKIDSNILSKTTIESMASKGDLQQLTLSKPSLHKQIDLNEETLSKIESDKMFLLETDVFSSADLSILQSLRQIENLDRSLSNGEEAEEAACNGVDAKILGAKKADPSVDTSSEIKLEHASPKTPEVKNTEIVSCLPDVEYKTLSLESKDPTFDDYVILSKTLEDEQKTFQDSKLTTLSDQLNEDSYFQDQHNTKNTPHSREETDFIKHESPQSVIDAKETTKTDIEKISEQQQLDEMSNRRPIISSSTEQIVSEIDNKIHPPKDSHGKVDESFLSASKERTTTSKDVHDNRSEMLHEIGKMEIERKESLTSNTALRDDNQPLTSVVGSSSTAEDTGVSNQVHHHHHHHHHHHRIDKQETKEELVKDSKMAEDDVKQPYNNDEGLLTEIKHQQLNQQPTSFQISTEFTGLETMSKTDLTELKVVGTVDKKSEEQFVQETTKEQTPETPIVEFKPEKENRAIIVESTQFTQEMKHSRSNDKEYEYELSSHTVAHQASKTLDAKELSDAKSLFGHQQEGSPLDSHESVETYLDDPLKMRENFGKQKAPLENLLLVQGKQEKSIEQQRETSKLEGDGQISKPGILPLNLDFEKKEAAKESHELSESRDQIISSDEANVHELSERIARRVSQEVNEELLNGFKQGVSKIATHRPREGLSTDAVGLSETSRSIPNEKSTTSADEVNESIDIGLNDGIGIAKNVSVSAPGDSKSAENIEALRKMELVGQTICNVEGVQPSIVDSQPIANKERDNLDSVHLSEQVLARTDGQGKESEEPLFCTSSEDIVIDNVLQKEDKLIHFEDDVITKSTSCHETSKDHFVGKTDDARFLDSLMTKDAVTTFRSSELPKASAELEEISNKDFKDPTTSVVKGESYQQDKILTASTSAEPIISPDRNVKDDEGLMKDVNLHDEDLSESTGADLSDSFPITPRDKYADSVDIAFEGHKRESDEKVEPHLISVEQFIGHEVREDNFREYPRREITEFERSSDLTSNNGFNHDAESSQFCESEQVFKSSTLTDESQRVDEVIKDAESAAATSGVVERGELEKTKKQEEEIEKFRENLLIDFGSSKSDVSASIHDLTDEKDEVFEFKINKTESFAPHDTRIDSTSDKYHSQDHASRATPTTSTGQDFSPDSLPAKHCDEVEFEDISSTTIMPSIDRTSIVIKMTRPSSSSSPTDILFESDCPEATPTPNSKVVRDEGSFETGDSKSDECVMDVVASVTQSTTSGTLPPDDDINQIRPISIGKDVTVSEENVTLQHESSAENKDHVQREMVESLEKMETSVRNEQASLHDVNTFEGNHFNEDICDPYLKGSKGTPTMIFHDDDDDDSEVEDDSSDVDFKSEGDYSFGHNSWCENRKETLRKRANEVSLKDMTPCGISKDFESEIVTSHQGFPLVEAKQSPAKTMGDEVIQENNKADADGVTATNDDSSTSSSLSSSSVTTENLGMQLTKSLTTTAISLSDAKLGEVEDRNNYISDESVGSSHHVDARDDIEGKDREPNQNHHQNYNPTEVGWTGHYPSVDCLTLMTSDMNRRLRSTFDLPSDRHPDDRDNVTKPKV